MLEGNHNVSLMEQFSPSVMQVEVAMREFVTWPINNHMGYNQSPLDDIFELSRLFAYTLSSSSHQKGSQGVSNQSATPKTLPPSVHTQASDSTYQSPSSLRVDELANWLGEDPTGAEYNSAVQGLSGPMDLQGSFAFPSLDVPEFVETSACLGMQPYIEPTLAKDNAQTSTSFSSLPKEDLALPMDVSFPPELAKMPLNSIGDESNSFLPNSSVCAPTTCNQTNVSNIKIMKEIQLSQRVDEECYHLSIEDTKRITLKVSKVFDEDEASGCDGMRGEPMHGHHEQPINHFGQQGASNSLQVSHAVEKVINHSAEERAEKVDETFEDCLALDLQDIASLDIQDYPSNYQINLLNYQQYPQPSHILPLPNPPYPYNVCAHIDPTPNNCWGLSCMHPNSHSMSFSPLSCPTHSTSYVFGPAGMNRSEGTQMHTHYMSHDRGVPLTRTSFFNNLHWSSPVAKTRAARKRRMPRKLFHNIVPYQSHTSSSLAWLTGAMPNNIKENATGDHARETSLEKTEGQILGVDKTKLRFLLQKKLKPSDVGNLGRIILPKKDAEAYLPRLNEREGMPITMENINGSQNWNLRFRYWPNNKSRMYLFEQTRSLVDHYKLREGDYVMFYRDDFANKYVIMTKRFAT